MIASSFRFVRTSFRRTAIITFLVFGVMFGILAAITTILAVGDTLNGTPERATGYIIQLIGSGAATLFCGLMIRFIKW